ncbi:MAG: transmembrane 220 family protein [Flavobacteriales bacterium]
MKKFVFLLLAVVFVGFAYVNLNYPDPFKWVAAYASTAVLFAFAAFGRADRRIVGSLALSFFVWTCTLLPGMVDWINAGMPSITDEMQTTAPHIEVVREFLGLLIAVLALAVLLFATPRDARMG